MLSLIYINQYVSFQFNSSTSILCFFTQLTAQTYTKSWKGKTDTQYKQNSTITRSTKAELKWEFNGIFWNYYKFFYTGWRLYTDDHKQLSYYKTTSNNQAAVTYHCFLLVCPSGEAKWAWATCVHLKLKLTCLPLEVRQVKKWLEIPKGAEAASTESQWSTELGGSAIASFI